MREGGWKTLEEANMSLATSMDALTNSTWKLNEAMAQGWTFIGQNA